MKKKLEPVFFFLLFCCVAPPMIAFIFTVLSFGIPLAIAIQEGQDWFVVLTAIGAVLTAVGSIRR